MTSKRRLGWHQSRWATSDFGGPRRHQLESPSVAQPAARGLPRGNAVSRSRAVLKRAGWGSPARHGMGNEGFDDINPNRRGRSLSVQWSSVFRRTMCDSKCGWGDQRGPRFRLGGQESKLFEFGGQNRLRGRMAINGPGLGTETFDFLRRCFSVFALVDWIGKEQ